jgi:hypothetical protein
VPALDRRAASAAAPPAATRTADVATILATHTTASARGLALGVRAVSNAQAELPFIREAFVQLGAAGFDVALAMMDERVNADIGLLAAQRDGAAILAVIRTALGAVPVAPTPDQTASLTRATTMLGAVAGVVAVAPSARAPVRAEKVIRVDTLKLDGSNHNPVTQVAVANAIYAQCNVRFEHGVDRTATPAETTGWLGADRALRVSTACGTTTAEERALFSGPAGGPATYGMTARMRAFFVAGITGLNASGYSVPPFCATGTAAPFRNFSVVENSGDTSTLAHELGHILLNSGGHPTRTLMEGRPRPNELTDPQCTTIYNNA